MCVASVVVVPDVDAKAIIHFEVAHALHREAPFVWLNVQIGNIRL